VTIKITTQKLLNFVFCWPCILMDQYNKNKPDTLFILHSFRQSRLHVSGMLLPIIRRYHCIYIYTVKPV
jgi:hypothetical protein